MATTPKTTINPHFAAFPMLFKRTGEARRIKGFRANRDMFNRAIRMSKVLDMSPRLAVMTPIGAIVLSEAATKLLKEDNGVSALIINGYEIIPARDHVLNDEIAQFLHANNLIKGEDLLTQNMFDEDEQEHLGKGSR